MTLCPPNGRYPTNVTENFMCTKPTDFQARWYYSIKDLKTGNLSSAEMTNGVYPISETNESSVLSLNFPDMWKDHQVQVYCGVSNGTDARVRRASILIVSKDTF